MVTSKLSGLRLWLAVALVIALIDPSSAQLRLMGAANLGGPNGAGTIFSVSPNGGANAQSLYAFPADGPGRNPQGGLMVGIDGERAYGVTNQGGPSFSGTIFSIMLDGSSFRTIHEFNYTDGGYPVSGLAQDIDGTIYGTTGNGGAYAMGVIFRISPDGSGFTVLHSFNPATEGSFGQGPLIKASDGRLYGTTFMGGTNNGGTIFGLNTDGTAFSILHTFEKSTGSSPESGLLEGVDGKLFGTASDGGTFPDLGRIFSISKDGSDYTLVRSLRSADGTIPRSTLIKGLDGTMYGTTSSGGAGGGAGTLFKLSPDGSTFTVLFNFNTVPTIDGYPVAWSPVGKLLLDGQKLYGCTAVNGPVTNGAVFKFDLSTNQFSKIADLTTASGFGLQNPSLIYGITPIAVPTYVVTPANGSINQNVTLTVEALPVPVETVTQYIIEINESPDFTGPGFIQAGDFSQQFSGLKYSTKYYARARTNAPQDAFPPSTFFTASPTFFAYIRFPGVDATNVVNDQSILTANHVYQAGNYTFQLSEQPDFSTIAFQTTSSLETVNISNLKYGTVYYDRVKTDLSPQFGASHKFTTRTAESISYLIGPANGATNVKTNVKMICNTVPFVNLYTIQLSRFPDFSVVDFNVSGSNPLLSLNGLRPGTTYYSRVKTNLSAVYGKVKSFTTEGFASARFASDEVEGVEIAELAVHVYPVPFHEKLNLFIESRNHAEADLVLMDLAGKVVHQSSEKTNSALEIERRLPQGIYILTVKTGMLTQTVKVAAE